MRRARRRRAGGRSSPSARRAESGSLSGTGAHFWFARSTSQAPRTVRGQLIRKAARTMPTEADQERRPLTAVVGLPGAALERPDPPRVEVAHRAGAVVGGRARAPTAGPVRPGGDHARQPKPRAQRSARGCDTAFLAPRLRRSGDGQGGDHDRGRRARGAALEPEQGLLPRARPHQARPGRVLPRGRRRRLPAPARAPDDDEALRRRGCRASSSSRSGCRRTPPTGSRRRRSSSPPGAARPSWSPTTPPISSGPSTSG